jgi:hypothetical protein
LIVGKSICGKGAVGSCKNATIPASTTAAVSNAVAMGRRMNGAEMPPASVVLVLVLMLVILRTSPARAASAGGFWGHGRRDWESSFSQNAKTSTLQACAPQISRVTT